MAYLVNSFAAMLAYAAYVKTDIGLTYSKALVLADKMRLATACI